MCAQRAHQNYVEFNSVFLPLFMAAGLVPAITVQVATCGAAIVALRLVTGIGYQCGADAAVKKMGGLFHIPELYMLYVVGAQAVAMMKADNMM